MENYVSAELDVITLAATETISASIEIDLDENELPLDRFGTL